MQTNNMKRREANMGELLKSALTGVITAMLICIALIALTGAGVSKGLLNAQHIKQYAYFSCGVSGAIGSIVAVVRSGRKMLPLALGVGASFFILKFIVGCVLFTEFSPAKQGMGLFCIDLVCAIVAGLLCGKGKKSPRKKR